jgi:hypothetical protein
MGEAESASLSLNDSRGLPTLTPDLIDRRACQGRLLGRPPTVALHRLYRRARRPLRGSVRRLPRWRRQRPSGNADRVYAGDGRPLFGDQEQGSDAVDRRRDEPAPGPRRGRPPAAATTAHDRPSGREGARGFGPALHFFAGRRALQADTPNPALSQPSSVSCSRPRRSPTTSISLSSQRTRPPSLALTSSVRPGAHVSLRDWPLC